MNISTVKENAMPTWANHFRIADKLLPYIKALDKEYFIIGNIAPDCGIKTDSAGVYEPPTGVTHFTKDYLYSKKTDCDYEFVYQNYIKDEKDIKKKSFFIGYWAHLFADAYYANNLFVPIEKEFGDFRENHELRRTVARERANIDYLYFSENISEAYEIFRRCGGFDEDYPKWYKNGEISRKMKEILKLYDNNKPVVMEYKYLTPEIMSSFVDEVSKTLKEKIKSVI